MVVVVLVAAYVVGAGVMLALTSIETRLLSVAVVLHSVSDL